MHKIIGHSNSTPRIDAANAAFSASASQPQSQGKKTPSSAANTPVQEKVDAVLTPKGSKKTTSHLQKLAAKPMELKERVATDFFGRAIKVMFNDIEIKLYNCVLPD